MTQIRIKRVYEAPDAADGYRVLVDRLWPRGIKKEHLKSDVREKDIYRTELEGSDAVRQFMERIKTYDTVTLLYASKDPIRNHARILQQFLSAHMA